jgi:hypothetical protein
MTLLSAQLWPVHRAEQPWIFLVRAERWAWICNNSRPCVAQVYMGFLKTHADLGAKGAAPGDLVSVA